MKLRAWPSFLFLGFFLLPYLLLFLFSTLPAGIDVGEFLWAFENTAYQAFGSAVLALFLGFVLCLGLFQMQRFLSVRMIKVYEYALLLPGFLPPIFILLVFLELINPFPAGLASIILIHSAMNAGIVAILLKRIFEQKIIGLSEMSLVSGASQLSFFIKVVGYLKRDFLAIMYFVFCSSFLSFSVPLTVGGGRGTTLEVLIYEKIRISNSWGEALTLSLIQGLFLLLLSLGPAVSEAKAEGRKSSNSLLCSWLGLGLSLIYVFGFLYVLGQGIWLGWDKVHTIPGLYEMALNVLPFSLFLSFAVGILVFILLLLSAWDFPASNVQRLIRGISSPSTSLVGFGFLVVAGASIYSQSIVWLLAFLLIYFTSLFRLGWAEDLESLRGQVQVARVLGAKPNLIFAHILVPQLIPKAALIAGLGSLWALGDFAISRIIFSQDLTLAMLIESLMSSYRIEAAMGLLTLYFACGFLLFTLFMGIHYVTRRELS